MLCLANRYILHPKYSKSGFTYHFETYALHIYLHVDLKYDYDGDFVLLPLRSEITAGFEKFWFNFPLAAVLLERLLEYDF